MCIENIIDEKEKVIHTICSGVMTLEDFTDHMKRIWSDTKYYGYNELLDTTQGDWTDFDFGYLFTIAEKASRLNTFDPNTKVAFVVQEGKPKALTDFYKNIKGMLPANSREMKAFYSKEEALAWLKS